MKNCIIVGFFLALVCAFSAEAIEQSNADKFAEYDTYMASLQKDLRAGKKELIALNLSFSR